MRRNLVSSMGLSFQLGSLSRSAWHFLSFQLGTCLRRAAWTRDFDLKFSLEFELVWGDLLETEVWLVLVIRMQIRKDEGRIEKWIMRRAFDTPENPFLPKVCQRELPFIYALFLLFLAVGF
jgi:hypothetical protein